MTSESPTRVVLYNPEWPVLFDELGTRLREAFREIALRIDQIGSTALRKLDAKRIIDIQTSVAHLEPIETFRKPLARCGFVWRSDNPELTKRYFRGLPGTLAGPP